MPKRYAYNTSATQVKKRYAMIGSTATQVKKRYAMIGSTATLVYSAEQELADLTANEIVITGFHPTGVISQRGATSESYWDLSEYNYVKGSFSNTLEQVSWGSGGGSFSNGTKYTYLKFKDGTTKLLFKGDSKTFTESDPIDLSGFTEDQKSQVYLYAVRDITINDNTNNYTSGEGKTTGCITYP